MKWFEHDTNARRNKKWLRLKLIYKAQGDDAWFAAYGRAWVLYEVVGSLEEDGKFELPHDYPLEGLCDEFGCGMDYLTTLLDNLATVELIDPEAWERGIVSIPKMAERADTYAKRKQGPKKEQQDDFKECSKNVRTNFEECSSHNTIPNQTIPNQTERIKQTASCETRRYTRGSFFSGRGEDEFPLRDDLTVAQLPSSAPEYWRHRAKATESDLKYALECCVGIALADGLEKTRDEWVAFLKSVGVYELGRRKPRE